MRYAEEPEFDDNLPTVAAPSAPPLVKAANVVLTPPEDLDEHTTIQDAKRVDVMMANNLMRAAYAGLTNAQSVSTLCKAIDQTIKVMEHRRKVLLLPYGSENTRARSGYLLPLD